MAQRTRKRKFSTFLCKAKFDGHVLEIQGRQLLVSFFLLGFTAAMAGLATTLDDVPMLIRVLMIGSGLFTLYGFVDVFFGECFLRYDVHNKALVVRRGSPFGRVRFEGRAGDKVSVSRISAGKASNSTIPLFTVVLTVTLDDAIVNFPLETLGQPDDASQQSIAQWEHKLGFPPTDAA